MRSSGRASAKPTNEERDDQGETENNLPGAQAANECKQKRGRNPKKGRN